MDKCYAFKWLGFKKLATKWMKRRRGLDILWKVAAILLTAFALWQGWSMFDTYCIHAINKDTVPMMAFVSVGYTTLLMLLPYAAYKLWHIFVGGQFYYMTPNSGIHLTDDEFELYYHPRKDRHFPLSVATCSIRYDQIKRVVVDRTYKLVTIEGPMRFSLTRFALGIYVPVENAEEKYGAWKLNQFFLAIEENGEMEFFKALYEHNVPVENQ